MQTCICSISNRAIKPDKSDSLAVKRHTKITRASIPLSCLSKSRTISSSNGILLYGGLSENSFFL